jgi:hypothetical protein
MKTAMQEAIEHFKNINYDLVNVPIQNVPHILEQFLEKEKEQIIDAHGTKGWYKPSDKKSGITTGEEYYNQTYNQNK